MREKDSWSRDVVLSALIDQIRLQRRDGRFFDFILLTGDLAYSGKAREYELVSAFIEALCEASGVPLDRTYCIPGNHDIDRDRQKLCLTGARATLRDQSRVDDLLGGGEDLVTLLLRQEVYRRFVSKLFVSQHRETTPDGLAYVARVRIDDVEIAIVALDSSWSADGGSEDHGKLLIGERQVINALEIAQSSANRPHLVIGMSHHPLHLLHEFDRNPVQNRIEQVCQFYHSGHLHEPETRTVSSGGSSCMMIAAGAAFESRTSRNVFSVVVVDLAEARRSVEVFRYQPLHGKFLACPKSECVIDLPPSRRCTMGELAEAISLQCPECSEWAHYLAGLLLGVKSDFPMARVNGIEFASISVIREEPESETRTVTLRFSQLRNILNILSGTLPLKEIIAKHGSMLPPFGKRLRAMSSAHHSAGVSLREYERSSKALAVGAKTVRSNYAIEVMQDMAEAHDWPALREYARRHAEGGDKETTVLAARMLAMSMAHSPESEDRQQAIDRFTALCDSPSRVVGDACHLVALLLNEGRGSDACKIVWTALEQFGSTSQELMDIGQRVVEATGDRRLRDKLSASRRRQ